MSLSVVQLTFRRSLTWVEESTKKNELTKNYFTWESKRFPAYGNIREGPKYTKINTQNLLPIFLIRRLILQLATCWKC